MPTDVLQTCLRVETWISFDDDTCLTCDKLVEDLGVDGIDGMIEEGVVIVCGPKGHAVTVCDGTHGVVVTYLSPRSSD